jgi:hypothetical protein
VTGTDVAARIQPDIRRARPATSVVFAVHGAVMGTFAARVPWLADNAGVGGRTLILSDARTGWL